VALDELSVPDMLAGVESLPHELNEAARVDGANEVQIYRYILLPLLLPTILVALMLRTILAFKVFDQIFLLTGGGPGTSSR
jgi:multiple sugar transport system permease protein